MLLYKTLMELNNILLNLKQREKIKSLKVIELMDTLRKIDLIL